MVPSVATEKFPSLTTPGTDPETVRLVAQCLDHYATPGPIDTNSNINTVINITINTNINIDTNINNNMRTDVSTVYNSLDSQKTWNNFQTCYMKSSFKALW
jgi:hypothetical protein